MSLTTAGAGGGAGAGGMSLAMGHHVQSSMPHRPGPSHSHTHAGPPKVMGVDKTTTLSGKFIEKTLAYPIISFDLYGSGEVAYCPPAEFCEDGLICLGTVLNADGDLILRRGERSYKALKRLLTKGDTVDCYTRVLEESFVPKEEGSGEENVVIRQPYLLLGSRRISQLHPTILKHYRVSTNSEKNKPSETAAAIEPLSETSDVVIRDQTLSGSSVVQNDDFDRVAFQVNLFEKKKPLTLLPEEAVGILLAYIKKWVWKDMKSRFNLENEEEEYMEYPLTIPLPGWVSDASLESHLEAINALSTTSDRKTQCRRSTATLAACLNPETKSKDSKMYKAIKGHYTRLKKEKVENVEGEDYLPLVFVVGPSTSDGFGVEGVAVQIGFEGSEDLSFKCLSEVNYQTSMDASLQKVLHQLQTNTSKLLPEINRKPTAILTYGSIKQQMHLQSQIKELFKEVTLISAKEEAVARGACLLTSIAHDRVYDQNGEGLSIDIKYVSSSAVGVFISEDLEEKSVFAQRKYKDEEIKVLFDFDRRTPAGPYILELSAAELISKKYLKTEEGLSTKEIKKFTNKKYIPEREKAALALKIQIVQRTEREGVWIPVGDVLTPLIMEKEDEEEEQEKKEDVACEKATVEISISDLGSIVLNVLGDGQSVVQATKSARKSTIQYYAIILFCILFFGGFLFKSWYEERVFDRDTKKLLAYYKHVIPGSIHDGDEYQARYLVWKYRGRKKVLWRRLEAKYGVAVPDEWKDDEEEEEKEEKKEEEVVDMDGGEEKEEEEGDEDDAKSDL